MSSITESVSTTALLLDRDLSLTVGTRELSALSDGEVLIDVEYAGICGSDLHVLRTGDWVAYWPATLGHEVAGRVRTSRHPDFAPGQAVVADSRIPSTVDGHLRHDRLAEDLQWLGEARPGGYAGAMVIPGDSLHRVPAGLDTVAAVLAEPLAVVMCALDQLRLDASPATVAILGYGPIGALAHAELTRRWPQAAVTVVEPNARRADLARSRGAAVDTLDGPARHQVVVDAAGYPGSLEAAIDATAFGGAVLLIAIGHAAATVMPATIVEHSLRVVGSVGFDDHHLDEALAALADEPGRYDPIVTHTVELPDVPAFLAAGGMGEAIKVLIRCAP